MKSTLMILLTALSLLIAPVGLAQVPGDSDGLDNMQGLGDGCASTMNPDDCMFSGGTTVTLCTKDFCPACAFNESQTQSICYYLQGNFGYCSCAPGPVAYDRYGNKFPNCNTNGSCVYRR